MARFTNKELKILEEVMLLLIKYKDDIPIELAVKLEELIKPK